MSLNAGVVPLFLMSGRDLTYLLPLCISISFSFPEISFNRPFNLRPLSSLARMYTSRSNNTRPGPGPGLGLGPGLA